MINFNNFSGKKIGSVITENDFIRTLSKKINGTLTLTPDEMDDKSADYASASMMRKVICVRFLQLFEINFDFCIFQRILRSRKNEHINFLETHIGYMSVTVYVLFFFILDRQ